VVDIAAILGGPDVRTIAIVGCSKNSGKTTVLNHVLEHLADGPERVGVLSIGIDGEEADFWLGVPKPRVSVREGYLVATADKAMKGSTAQVRTLMRTGAITALGELVLVRVEKPGNLLLAGVRHKADVRLIVDAMLKHQAQKVLIDGAYQRMMAADPDVSQGVILATGAVLGRSVKEVVRRTRAMLDRLLVPRIDDPDDTLLLRDALDHGRIAVRDADSRILLLPETGVAAGEAGLKVSLGSGDAVVALPGALTDRILKVLLAHKVGHVRILVSDPTRVFSSFTQLQKFRERGWDIMAGRAVNLLGISVNPVSILGYELPENELLEGIQAAAPGVPAFVFHEKPPSA